MPGHTAGRQLSVQRCKQTLDAEKAIEVTSIECSKKSLVSGITVLSKASIAKAFASSKENSPEMKIIRYRNFGSPLSPCLSRLSALWQTTV